MNKKIVCLVAFVDLFCTAHFAFGQGITNPIGAGTFRELLTQIAGAVGTLVASLGIVMIIVAGILYLTSAGSPERIGTAKKALIYAIVGIAIGLAATAIVNIIKRIIGA